MNLAQKQINKDGIYEREKLRGYEQIKDAKSL